MVNVHFYPPKGHTEGVSPSRQELSHLPASGLSYLLCHLRAHGAVCPGQRGGGCFNETPGGEQQGAVTTHIQVCVSVV